MLCATVLLSDVCAYVCVLCMCGGGGGAGGYFGADVCVCVFYCVVCLSVDVCLHVCVLFVL